jgi:hypothetical protein
MAISYAPPAPPVRTTRRRRAATVAAAFAFLFAYVACALGLLAFVAPTGEAALRTTVVAVALGLVTAVLVAVDAPRRISD